MVFVQENYCADFAQVLNVSNTYVTAQNMLRGRTVYVGVNLDASPLMVRFPANAAQKRAYTPDGGVLYLLQKEIARRGQFNLEYVQVDNYGEFKNTEDFLGKILPKCDIYGGMAVSDTSRRRDMTFDFTTRVLDNSIMLVTTSKYPDTFDLWYPFQPFEPVLWAVIVTLAAFHAFYFYFTEQFYSIEKDEEVEGQLTYSKLTLVDSVYESLGLMGDPNPQTIASSFVKLGYGLFIFVMIASYGANLANIYIQNQKQVLPMTSIADANDKNARICASTGTNSWCTDCDPWSATPYATINDTYPSVQLIMVNSSNPIDLMLSLHNGTCQGAVMTSAEWDSVYNYAQANVGCEVIAMPAYPNSVIRQFVGAFPSKLDYNTYCTSAVQVVWSTIVNQMYEDGAFQKVYQSWIDERTDINCVQVQKRAASIALSLSDLAGVFVVLGACMAAAVVLVLLIPSSCEREGKLYTPDAIRRVVQRMRLGTTRLGAGLREGTSKRLGRVFGGTVAEPLSHGSQGSREGSVEGPESRGGTKGGSRSLNLTALGTHRPTTRSATAAKVGSSSRQGADNNQSQPKSNRDSGLFGVPGPLPLEDDDDDILQHKLQSNKVGDYTRAYYT